MNLEDAINQRHSVRNFKDKPVKTEDIKKIVQLAQRTPSWVNSQPWKVYVAQGQALQNIKNGYLARSDQQGNPDLKTMHRDEWSADTQANMKEWRHDIVHHFPNFDEAHKQMSTGTANMFYAPAIIFITIPKKSSQWSILDAGAFSQTLMLAAKDQGLDTIPNYTSVKFPEIVRQETHIPEDEMLVEAISIGYARGVLVNNYRSKRVDVDDILTFND